MTRVALLVSFLWSVADPWAWASSVEARTAAWDERLPARPFETAQAPVTEIPPSRVQRTDPVTPKTQTIPPSDRQPQAPHNARPGIFSQQPSQPTPLTAEIDPPRLIVTQGQQAVFDSKSSADPSTAITVYQWVGPNQQTSSGRRFVVNTTNLKPSAYTITLTVSDQRRRQSRDTATLIVQAKASGDIDARKRPPVARINPVRGRVKQGSRQRFTSISYHPDGRRKIVQTSWLTSWGQRASGDFIDIDTSGLKPGEYTVRLEVTDEQGLTGRDEARLTIIDVPRDFDAAIIELDVLPAPTSPNQAVRIRAVTANRGKDALRNVLVRFEVKDVPIAEITLPSLGPGEAREVTAEWTPESAGEYVVLATINPDNQPPERNRTNNQRRHAIVAIAPLAVTISPGRLEVLQGAMAKFTAQVATPEQPAVRNARYFWRGPGNLAGEGTELEFDTREVPEGSHSIIVDVTHGRGITSTATATLIVKKPKTEIWLSADRPKVAVGEDVKFSSGTRPASRQMQYKFVFGDGTESEWRSESEAAHRYQRTGDYKIQVLARQRGVEVGAASVDINVAPITYAVFLKTAAQSLRAGNSLSFIAAVEPRTSDVEYRFVFGDGRDSGWVRDSRTLHSYAAPGAYNAIVEARIAGTVIRSPSIQITVAAAPQPPWFWLGAVLAAVATAAAAYARKRRTPRARGHFTVVPKLNLETLRAETEGKVDSGLAVSLRTVRGQSRSDVETSGSIVARS